MTTQTVYRFLCDGPECTRAEFSPSATGLPNGWRRLQSTDHIEPYRSSPYPARQRRSRILGYGERCIGSFDLHLCPDHHDAFNGHTPRTDGRPGGRSHEATVSVSCECGVRLGSTYPHTAISHTDGPPYSPHLRWWQHLPVELQAYANRKAS